MLTSSLGRSHGREWGEAMLLLMVPAFSCCMCLPFVLALAIGCILCRVRYMGA